MLLSLPLSLGDGAVPPSLLFWWCCFLALGAAFPLSPLGGAAFSPRLVGGGAFLPLVPFFLWVVVLASFLLSGGALLHLLCGAAFPSLFSGGAAWPPPLGGGAVPLLLN